MLLQALRTASSGVLRTRTVSSGRCHVPFSIAMCLPSLLPPADVVQDEPCWPLDSVTPIEPMAPASISNPTAAIVVVDARRHAQAPAIHRQKRVKSATHGALECIEDPLARVGVPLPRASVAGAA